MVTYSGARYNTGFFTWSTIKAIIMRVTVDGKEIEVSESSTVLDSLKQLKLNPEIFLVKRDNEIIHENERLRENDRLELIKVISGG